MPPANIGRPSDIDVERDIRCQFLQAALPMTPTVRRRRAWLRDTAAVERGTTLRHDV